MTAWRRGKPGGVPERAETARPAELPDSERRLRAAMRLCRLGYYIWDFEKRRNVYCTEEFAAIHGMSVEEYMQDAAAEEEDVQFIHPDDRQLYSDALALREATGEPLVLEYRIVGRDGVTRHVREVESITPLDADNPALMEGTLQDITEIKQLEHELRQSEGTYRGILDNLEDTYYRTGLDGRVQMVSPSGKNLLGYAPDEVVGHKLEDLYVDPAGREEFLRLLAENGGRISGFDAWLRHKDGHPVLVSTNARYLLGDDGQVIGVEGTARDVTERRRAEELNTRLGRILEESLNEIYVFGTDDLRFVMANRGARENTGYSMDELTAMKPHDIKRDATPEEFRQIIAPLLSGERDDIHLETNHYRKDGSAYPVRARLQIFRSEVTPVIFVVAEDVSAQKHTEKQLVQAQKMEAIGQLTGGVAHDFNNLLAVIQGNAELLREEVGAGEDLVAEIVAAARRGAELTQRLLMYARQQPLWPETLDLGRLIDGLLPMMKRTLGAPIGFETDMQPGLWLVKADPGQVENAVLNLAINARDAMPEGGTLTVACRNELLSADDAPGTPGRFVVLSISDDGHGMSQETIDRAFEPFFTTKGVGKGSGLGLSMVYGFAKQSGGQVTIDSVEGRGTSVNLYLPATRVVEDGARAAEPAAPANRGAGETVLVIEDEAAVGRMTEKMLRSFGYDVIVAPDAAAAARIFASGAAIDLVLSDVVLPGEMSGPKFIRGLQETKPDLKVVFMSGYPTEALEGNDDLDSRHQLLAKPFQASQLAATIRKALDR
ncbi:PAS domain S-box protein [Citreimonas sp.]|uniref:PAS domain S-box protein n=1 Tax=Citreimonas sp. TaxID=3036715 RepID=UPI004059AAA7